ncbi:MAG: hypothetical protein ACK41O_23330 [Runella zeae]
MHQYLIDVTYFVQNYAGRNGFYVVLGPEGMRSRGLYQVAAMLSLILRVTSMNQLEYWFDAKKKVTESQIKEKFKLMMYDNGPNPGLTPQGLQVFNAIWSNTALRANLWSDIQIVINQTIIDNYKSKFAAIVADTNHLFYRFI